MQGVPAEDAQQRARAGQDGRRVRDGHGQADQEAEQLGEPVQVVLQAEERRRHDWGGQSRVERHQLQGNVAQVSPPPKKTHFFFKFNNKS